MPCALRYGIVGCGGGGGSSAPVPPVTNPISGGGSVLDQGKAASLFDSIDGRGEAWLGLVDSDSGFFHLTGEDPETNEILEKIPEIDTVTSTQLRFDDQDLTIIRSKILGGLFGLNAQEAGVLFGIADDQGWVFSGGASGVQKP